MGFLWQKMSGPRTWLHWPREMRQGERLVTRR